MCRISLGWVKGMLGGLCDFLGGIVLLFNVKDVNLCLGYAIYYKPEC